MTAKRADIVSMPSGAMRLREVTAPRRGLRREEAAMYVGVSPSKFDEMISDGRMPRPKRIDGRTVWDLRALDLAFDSLPDESKKNPWDGE